MEHHISEIDVLDRVLEKGIVIDSHARMFVLGVDVLTTIDSRVVVASIDTYLKIAEKTERITSTTRPAGLRVRDRAGGRGKDD